MNKSTITYDRKKQQWLVNALGEIQSFPAGPEGQQAAHEAALKAGDPQVYGIAFYLAHDLFRHKTNLHGRIWRAAQIVADGCVLEPYEYDDRGTDARVKSSRKSRKNFYYELTHAGQGSHWLCDCFDYRNRTAPTIHNQRMCKHIIAVKMHKLLHRPFHPWPTDIDPPFRNHEHGYIENIASMPAAYNENEIQRQIREKKANMKQWRRNGRYRDLEQAGKLPAVSDDYSIEDANNDLI